jgi:hemerythrin superfamily protein
MNALQLLKEDHDRVRQLFSRFRSSQDQAEHRKLFEQIKKDLETHSHIEETVFYPAAQEFDELEDLVDESFEEHNEVADLLDEIDELNEESEDIRDKMAELIQSVEQHAQKEENEMFSKARELMKSDDLESLGREMKSEKDSFSSAA